MMQRPTSSALPAYALFIAAVLLIVTQAQPFASLSDYAALSDPTQSNDWRRISTVIITLVCGTMVCISGRLPLLIAGIGWTIPLAFGWFFITSLVSPAPGLALNRLALAGAVIFIGFCLPLAFDRPARFVFAYGLAATIVVLLCLAGVLFLPDLAIHTRQDIVEQGLAGDWRGIFRHKNDLGPMAAHFVFVGLLLWRAENKTWGALVTGAALMLLVFSGAKSAALLLAPALAAAAMVTRIRTPFWSGIVALSMVGGLLLVTVGSVMLPSLQAIIVGVLPDASFTGRSDVWELALNAIGQRPIAGYGYGVFWDTNLTYSVAAAGDTAALMSHSHNGYLETAISGGLPGLALILAWAVILPLRHIAIVKAQGLRPGGAALLEFFVASWLFVLLLSAFEAVLFNRGDAIWFTGTLSISALALWARAPLAE